MSAGVCLCRLDKKEDKTLLSEFIERKNWRAAADQEVATNHNVGGQTDAGLIKEKVFCVYLCFDRSIAPWQ